MLTFTIPGHPPSPNRSRTLHYHVRAGNDLAWRTTAYFAALDVRPQDFEPLTEASVRVVYIIPDKRRRDPDNALASAKPCIDGIVDAGLLTDDSFRVIRHLSVTSEPGPEKAVRFELSAWEEKGEGAP